MKQRIKWTDLGKTDPLPWHAVIRRPGLLLERIAIEAQKIRIRALDLVIYLLDRVMKRRKTKG